MKNCFIHDAKVYKDEDGHLYTGGSFSEDVWRRYTDNFGHLDVITRFEEKTLDENDKGKYNIFDETNKTFIPLKVMNIQNMRKTAKENYRILLEEIKKHDNIIIRLPSFCGVLAARACRSLKKPYTVEVVGCAWDSLWNLSMTGKCMAPIMYFLDKHYIKHSINAVYITKQFLQSRYPTKGNQYVCSNVSLSDAFGSKRTYDIRSKDEIVLATIANVDVKYKGQRDVIKALAILSKKYNVENVRYKLIGYGDKTYLSKVAEHYGVLDKIDFDGPKSHKCIFGVLDNVDIYIQPSYAEGQGRSLIEAMSRGCACLCSHVGGMVELLNERQMFQKGNSEQISERINEAINDFSSFSEDSLNNSYGFSSDNIIRIRNRVFQKIRTEIESRSIQHFQ